MARTKRLIIIIVSVAILMAAVVLILIAALPGRGPDSASASKAPIELLTYAPSGPIQSMPPELPSSVPTGVPTEASSQTPTDAPTDIPTDAPADIPAGVVTDIPSPSLTPEPTPSSTPAPPSLLPTTEPTPTATPEPTPTITPEPTPTPTPRPSLAPSPSPEPTPDPTPGTDGLSGPLADTLKALADTVRKSMDGNGPPMTFETAADESNCTYLLGLTAEQMTSYVEEASISESMFGFGYQLALVRCKDDSSAWEVKKRIAAGYDPGRWVCVSPEECFVLESGRYVLMGAGAADVCTALREAFGAVTTDSVGETDRFYQR